MISRSFVIRKCTDWHGLRSCVIRKFIDCYDFTSFVMSKLIAWYRFKICCHKKVPVADAVHSYMASGTVYRVPGTTCNPLPSHLQATSSHCQAACKPLQATCKPFHPLGTWISKDISDIHRHPMLNRTFWDNLYTIEHLSGLATRIVA